MRDEVFLHPGKDRESSRSDQNEILTTRFTGELIKALKEIIVGGEGWVDLPAHEARCLQVLPLSGSLQVVINRDASLAVHSGESARIALPEDAHVKISSTSVEPANALAWYVSRPAAPPQVVQFEVDANMDRLLEVHSSPSVRIGQFHGRHAGQIEVSEGCVIVFAIEGTFEVEGRLIERRDALVFHGRQRLVFESLSNFAIMLTIES
jgi:hypothetical protein